MRLPAIWTIGVLALFGAARADARPTIYVMAIGPDVLDDFVVAASESLRGALDADVRTLASVRSLSEFMGLESAGALMVGITNLPFECAPYSDAEGCAYLETRHALLSPARIEAHTKWRHSHALYDLLRMISHAAVRDVGHLLGLEPCHDPGCAMNDHLSLKQVFRGDGDHFGPVCRGRLAGAGVPPRRR
jgi:predicted Zn-dependent protease